MATVDQRLGLGQETARHLLPTRNRIDETLKTLGYSHPKIIEVIGGLLSKINKDPTVKALNLWRYQPEGGDTGMEARLYASPLGFVLTTTAHRSTNWELQSGRKIDPGAAAEYGKLYGEEKPGYKFKMVMFEPSLEADQTVDLVHAAQADRRLPFFGLNQKDWRFFGIDVSRWAIQYDVREIGEDVLIKLSQPGTRTAELYKFLQQDPGKIHVAARLVNVDPNRLR